MDRRSLLKLAAALGASGLPVPALLTSRLARGQALGDARAFDFAWLRDHARELASRPHESRQGQLPASLQELSWDDYQGLRFRPEEALWRDRDSAFRIRMFHLGLYFQTPVRIHEVVDGQARELGYDPDHFSYEGEQALTDLPPDLGYAGFRVHFHTNFRLDLAAFLGASYFRAVGEEMQYGLSARGLAIDTGRDREEEFPVFTGFWLQRPRPGATGLTVYALLESPSITGAYRFDIYPGRNLEMAVDAALYPRRAIERLGIAPLTSMYQVGENDQRVDHDWRPEIHDSDGLALWTGAGERIWRPLVNPATVRVNSFVDNNPRGFGLLQRDRNFDHYQDDGVFYNRRPGAWVEPGEHWGEGAVMLVEIPTRDETLDNIVAFWNPETPLAPDREHRFSYRLSWGATPPQAPRELATTRATRTGLGGVIGQPREYFSWRFAIDFAGGNLAMLAADAAVEPVISTSGGKVEVVSARPLAAPDGYRVMFDLVPGESAGPVDLRVYLRLGDQALTETWIYQYTPPPPGQRSF